MDKVKFMARKLRVEYPGAMYRIPQDSGAGRRQLEAAMEERRASETGADYQKLRRGWCCGGKAFRKELLGQMQEQMGAERQEAAELRRRHWREEHLMRRAKGDPAKDVLAVRLRAETVMTGQWIVERWGWGRRVMSISFYIGNGKQAAMSRPHRDRSSDDECTKSKTVFHPRPVEDQRRPDLQSQRRYQLPHRLTASRNL